MRIKICGMSEQRLIDEAAALGVEFCGFVFYEPSPRNVSPRLVASLDTHGMKRVGVFVRQSAEETERIASEAGLDFVQLHGGQSAAFAGRFPAERVIRVLWPGEIFVRAGASAGHRRLCRHLRHVPARRGHGQRPGARLAESCRSFVSASVVSFRRTRAGQRGKSAFGLFSGRARLQLQTGILPGQKERGTHGKGRGGGSRMRKWRVGLRQRRGRQQKR